MIATYSKLAGLCALLLATHGALADGSAPHKEIHRERSLYRDVIVTQGDGQRCMAFGRYATLRQTCISLAKPDEMVLEYSKMALSALYLHPNPRRILVIGMGGGVLPKALQTIYPNLQLDIVEIDPAVIKVAKQFFNYQPSPGTRIFAEDGRYFVKKALKQNIAYDHIILDAFDENYIPEHLLTVEFLRETKRLLSPNGVISSNTFSASRLYDSESATYQAALGSFYMLRKVNRVILYKNQGLPSMDEIRANAAQLEGQLQVFGASMDWLLPLVQVGKGWDENARVFTDQFSPVNLINR
jgi:spermidine synthase